MKGFLVSADVTLVSVEAVNKQPDFATIGGFSVTTQQEKNIDFDWVSYSGSSDILDNKHVEVGFTLKEFDEEYFKDNNEDLSVPDWEEIVKGIIGEVYYEAGFINNGEEDLIEMDLVSFTLYFYDGSKEHELNFTDEQIKTYNETIANERAKQLQEV